jgi:hypothetical protein
VAYPEEYWILFTDNHLQVLGDPITCWTELDITLRFNEPGTAIITMPAEPWIVDQVGAGRRAVVIRSGQVLIAGPIEKYLHERSDNGDNAGIGKLTVTSTDDLASIAARVAYPNPAQLPSAQTVDQWAFTGNAELGIRQLVDTNAGPSALAARRVPNLVLGAVASVGTSVTATADRMQPLLDVARNIATNDDVGFRTRQIGTQIVFDVFKPPDKSGTVRFSFGLNNLTYLSYEVTAPTATTAIVGGQGDGADRYMIERDNATETLGWGRFETYVARAGSSPLQSLQDDGDQALIDGAATTRLATTTSDTPDQRFGVHYQLGDKVAVETFPGQQYADLVRTVHLQVYATSGEYVSSTVGSQAASYDPIWAQRLRDIDARLGRLERSVVPAS